MPSCVPGILLASGIDYHQIDQILFCTYEDFVSDSKNEMFKLADYLGLIAAHSQILK